LTSPTFAMVCPTVRMDPMSTVVAKDVDVNQISSFAVTQSVWSVPGVVMVRTIVVIIPMRNPVIPSPVAPPVATVNSNAQVAIAFPRASSAMI